MNKNKKKKKQTTDTPEIVWEETPEYVERGLSDEDVRLRIEGGKVNGEQTVRTKSVLQIFMGNIFTFFNFVFLAMAIILLFFVSRDTSGLGNFGFVGLVIVNATIRIVQELRAKKTMDELSLISAPHVKVLRNGETSEVNVPDVLLDDLMILSAGNQICADGIVVDGDIEVNEALITGEPDAIRKRAGDKIMSGSCVISGKAKARVIHIGMDNFAMKISAGAKYFKKPNSEIWKALMRLVKIMAFIIVPLGVALFGVKYCLQHADLNITVVNIIGSLVGMIPNGLVALSSSVFCISVIRLSRHKTLAQDMYCVETLARVDVLCLDKTGTITTGEMDVYGIEPRNGLEKELFCEMLTNLMHASQDENATAVAIRAFVQDTPVTGEAEFTVPFSSARKWSGAFINGKSFILGAPEFILENDEDLRTFCSRAASQGLRVLAVASSFQKIENNTLPENIELEGFVYLSDKIRPEAPDTLRFFREEGVTVKLISGDNPVTVRAVAVRAGLENCDSYIDLSTLPKDTDYAEIAEKYTIFGRVLPDQKLALVKALKKLGHTVAMTGDGVNDVLALKEADCSVAVASGSDAAKNVSSLVLLDNNFASLPKVVAEGRRSINNLERSASLFLMKTLYNFLLALLFLIVPTDLPFAPQQLTFIGMVTIGIPSFILALEPNKERVTGRFLPKVLCNALPGSLMVVIGIGLVLLAKQYLLPDMTDEQAQIVYVLITTFVGFIYLFKVCLPFNAVHVILFLGDLAIFVGVYFINVPFIDLQELFGLSTDFTREVLWTSGAIASIVLPWFIILLKVTSSMRVSIEKSLDLRDEKKKKRKEKRKQKQARRKAA